MGHKISKEQIDPGVKDHIMSFVGDVADLETEVNTDIISAVNSLMVDRVDNIESIGKLAEAIGEPVTASDSIDEVVDKVDELVTSFKSKVLNAGIMYESGDKFKELIAKLEGLVAGEGGNNGLQLAMGEGNVIGGDDGYQYFQVRNLEFKPDVVIIYERTNFVMYNGLKDENNFYYVLPGGDTSIADIIPMGGSIFVDANGFSFSDTTAEINDVFTYYAIGVGEGQEDSTLLETLKSILSDEQVEVSDEDTMADLIVKVDSEFDDKNTEIANRVIPAGDAISSDVIDGKSFINNTGQTIIGTMTNQGSKNITPSKSSQSLPAGYYSEVIIEGDNNLKAANIVDGKTIFGITGTAITTTNPVVSLELIWDISTINVSNSLSTIYSYRIPETGTYNVSIACTYEENEDETMRVEIYDGTTQRYVHETFKLDGFYSGKEVKLTKGNVLYIKAQGSVMNDLDFSITIDAIVRFA